MNSNFSVLMSVYKKENPKFLYESIQSMLEQSLKPDEIILMIDGPLTDDLEKVIDLYKNNNLIQVYRNEKNLGLGKSLNIGLEKCKNEFIIRMDTDDISHHKRCEEQIKFLNINPDISVVGSSIIEFKDSIKNKKYIKSVETQHKNIIDKIKYRNPMNHPSVAFRKTHVIKSGGYLDLNLNEDYYLWIRMLLMGYKFSNINEPLLYMRINDETYLRRGGLNYFITQKLLFDFMKQNKLVNNKEYYYNLIMRFIIRVCIPNKLRKFIYTNLLRKKVL